MNYKMIALDLDGTLNNDEKVITPKTKEALIEAQKRGALVVLASGRQAPGLQRESDALELEKFGGLLLSYNGAKVVDAKTKKVIYENSIELDFAKKVLKDIEQYDINPIVDDGEAIHTTSKDSFMVAVECKNNNMKTKIVNNIADEINFRPCKILMAAPNEVLVKVSDKIRVKYDDKLTFTFSTPFFFEANNKGISKAGSLQKICDIYGIKREEVIAFGDAQNDLSMIEFAGLGVAMENACDELKAAADKVTLSNNDDGIAYALEHFTDILKTISN